MDTPTTEAGKALVGRLTREVDPEGWTANDSWNKDIRAIEAEAAAAERERMRCPEGAVAHDDDDRALEARLAEAERLLRAVAVEPYPGILCWCGSDGGPDHYPECDKARAFLAPPEEPKP